MAEVAGVGTRDVDFFSGEFGVFELKVRLKNGDEACFFRGREEGELNWIATVLRKEMDLPS